METLQPYLRNTLVDVRPATEDDREYVYNLRKELMREYIEDVCWWNEEVERVKFNNSFDPRYTAILGFMGNFPIGSVGLYVNSNFNMHVKYFYIQPDYQGNGIGTEVMGAINRVADDYGLDIRLEVIRNSPARRLYERSGFRLVSEGPRESFFIRRAVA